MLTLNNIPAGNFGQKPHVPRCHIILLRSACDYSYVCTHLTMSFLLFQSTLMVAYIQNVWNAEIYSFLSRLEDTHYPSKVWELPSGIAASM